MSTELGAARIELLDLHPATDSLCDDVRRALGMRPPVLPPKYFYDRTGALLFERIMALEEYYLTRTEIGILGAHALDIAASIGPGARVVELGSGNGIKTRILLRHLEDPAAYIPVDISRAQLIEFARDIAAEFPRLEVLPVCADYTGELTLPASNARARQTVAFFPGSTIGNLEHADAAAFLRRVARLCGAGGRLLIGADLDKERAILERAYNDASGVTAAFNLNLLDRINRECGADFDTKVFRHEAIYDTRQRRIEMRLVSQRASAVTVAACGSAPALHVRFAPGDCMITEYSHKYTRDGFADLAGRSGWRVERFWTDEREWFGVWLLVHG
jgi:L-histidine Nalpha-methyltransferase